MRPLVDIFIAALATWRLTHLLWAEDGPWDLSARLRGWAGRRDTRLFECFYCVSFWAALPAALIISCSLSYFLLNWLAISGGAIMLERFTATAAPAAIWRDETPPDPPLDPQGEA